MPIHPDCEPRLNDVPVSSGDLTAEEGVEAMLHRFLGVLNSVEPPIAQRMRDEIANRFGGRYCSGTLCAMMAEMVNGRLASDHPPSFLP